MAEYEKFDRTTRENAARLQRGLPGDLDEVVRQGVLRMFREVLEVEVDEFLGRKRHEGSSIGLARNSEEFRGYRNGYGKSD
jgi:hypothetical protein